MRAKFFIGLIIIAIIGSGYAGDLRRRGPGELRILETS